jgi:hypothetical protein
MDRNKIDINLLQSLYPSPKPADPLNRCGYCVGGALMAFLDGVTAAMAESGQSQNGRLHYFPLAPELSDILETANPNLPLALAARYAEFITRLNDRKRYNFAWSYLKEALEWNGDQCI